MTRLEISAFGLPSDICGSICYTGGSDVRLALVRFSLSFFIQTPPFIAGAVWYLNLNSCLV